MSTHIKCFKQKYENTKKNVGRKLSFLQPLKSLYVAWACFRNELASFVFKFRKFKLEQHV